MILPIHNSLVDWASPARRAQEVVEKSEVKTRKTIWKSVVSVCFNIFLNWFLRLSIAADKAGRGQSYWRVGSVQGIQHSAKLPAMMASKYQQTAAERGKRQWKVSKLTSSFPAVSAKKASEKFMISIRFVNNAAVCVSCSSITRILANGTGSGGSGWETVFTLQNVPGRNPDTFNRC